MMKITMYGSHLCQDVIYALAKIKDYDVEITFKNISVDFSALKEFMKIRENSDLFDEIKRDDKLGIPFFILEDNTQTFNFKEIIEKL